MERVDEKTGEKRNDGRYKLGIVLIIIGLAFLLGNLELIPYELKQYIYTWQMLLIAIGLVSLTQPKSRYGGLILIGVGTFFLIPKIIPGYEFFEFSRMFWPLLLIFIGVMVLLKRRDHKQYCPPHNIFTKTEGVVNVDVIDEVNIFGGSKKQMASKNFQGGRITSIFGGSEIDLTQAQLANGTNYLELTCIFGGVSLVIPPDWEIKVEMNNIMGGFGDKRRISPITQADKILVIRGVAIFGGGELK